MQSMHRTQRPPNAKGDVAMPQTRRVFDMLENLVADPDLVRALLTSRSTSRARSAYTALRAAVPDGALVMLANLREVIAEIPETPFLTGHPIEGLEHLGDYERCEHSYRRVFESERGVFGLEFMGEGTNCEAIVVHTASERFALGGDVDSIIDQRVYRAALEHRTLVDEVLRALQVLGVPLDPRVYVSVDDFSAEYAAASVDDMFSSLF